MRQLVCRIRRRLHRIAGFVREPHNFSPSGQKPLVGDVNADHRADAVLFTKGSAGDVYVSLAQP